MTPQSDTRTLYVLVSSLAGTVLSLAATWIWWPRRICHVEQPFPQSLPRLCQLVASDRRSAIQFCNARTASQDCHHRNAGDRHLGRFPRNPRYYSSFNCARLLDRALKRHSLLDPSFADDARSCPRIRPDFEPSFRPSGTALSRLLRHLMTIPVAFGAVRALCTCHVAEARGIFRPHKRNLRDTRVTPIRCFAVGFFSEKRTIGIAKSHCELSRQTDN